MSAPDRSMFSWRERALISEALAEQLLKESVAERQRTAGLEQAADRMERAIGRGIRDGLTDCREACEHPGCELIRARDAYRRLESAATSSSGAVGACPSCGVER